ncbi:MAG: MazG-like protein [Prevotella sp.]|nr:MazG-like protein [Prevotella sp.]
MDLREVEDKSAKIRKAYQKLEQKYHGSIWSIEEDALAFLTDAGIVGRLVMSQQGRWPSENEKDLPSKIGECVWWLAVLSKRMKLDFNQCVESFLSEKQELLDL